MYHLYIDESGDEGDYVNSNGTIIAGSSKYFTIGGIIVKDTDVTKFNTDYSDIISTYFNGITLPSNFKLHYYPLRHCKPPYDQLSQTARDSIEKEVFDSILRNDCTLLSVTIDLEKHCTYPRPANPRAYSLLLMLERFQYFLAEQNSIGVAIYERFNAKMRKKAEMEMRRLQKIPSFPVPTQLNNVRRRIMAGDPTQEPILNMADFFAFLPYQRRKTRIASNYFKSIKHKYYDPYGYWLHTGWVEL